ncbi:MAG TPA: cation diffusion facilitator family transporter [Hyphomicrobiaceae bacterium]|jgi:cobalt-zinc-cadmium efflux system protein|nr:cation diffusion facilitator family transporter [Hyphomicrobiaceae bacterium]
MQPRSQEPTDRAHHHGHGHAHDHTGDANPAALRKVLALTGAFLVVEVVGGILTGSLALLSDAAHMFTDTVALAIALAAVKLGERAADSRRTFGYQRFEILAATVNAVLLFLVGLYILYEGYRRLIAPPEMHSLGMLVIAALGLGVNLLAMRILFAGQKTSVNMRGAYLEVWSDALCSVGVLIGALILWLTGWTWVDTLVAAGIGLWVLPRAWSLLKETVNVLLEGVPEGIELDEVADAITSTAGVADVHDLHIWALTSNTPSLSAHVVVRGRADTDAVRIAVASALAHRFGIHHVTLQTERVDCRTLEGPAVVH